MKSSGFMLHGGPWTAWPLAALMHEGRLIRSIAVQVIASVVLLQTLTVVWAEEAAIPSNHKFVDELARGP